MARDDPDRQNAPINVVHEAKRTFLRVQLKYNVIGLGYTGLPAEGENEQVALKPPINVVQYSKSGVIHRSSLWPTPIGMGHSLET
jgi:hypothetical protein